MRPPAHRACHWQHTPSGSGVPDRRGTRRRFCYGGAPPDRSCCPGAACHPWMPPRPRLLGCYVPRASAFAKTSVTCSSPFPTHPFTRLLAKKKKREKNTHAHACERALARWLLILVVFSAQPLSGPLSSARYCTILDPRPVEIAQPTGPKLTPRSQPPTKAATNGPTAKPKPLLDAAAGGGGGAEMAEGNGGSGGAADVRVEAESSEPTRATLRAMPREECVEGIRSALQSTRPARRHHGRCCFSRSVPCAELLTPCCVVWPRRSDGAVPDGEDGEGRMPGVAALHQSGNLRRRRGRLQQRAWGIYALLCFPFPIFCFPK